MTATVDCSFDTRDLDGDERDRLADERDRRADERDARTVDLRGHGALDGLRRAAGADRVQAASDRAEAASDRRHSENVRLAAGHDTSPAADEAALAAHRLLNSSAVVLLGIGTLHESWDEISGDDRELLLERMQVHSTSIEERLREIAQGR